MTTTSSRATMDPTTTREIPSRAPNSRPAVDVSSPIVVALDGSISQLAGTTSGAVSEALTGSSSPATSLAPVTEVPASRGTKQAATINAPTSNMHAAAGTAISRQNGDDVQIDLATGVEKPGPAASGLTP